MNSEIQYLTDVLGVTGFASQSAKVQASQFVVYTPFAMSAAEKDLVGKMLAAIGILEAKYVHHENLENGLAEALSADSLDSRIFGICFGVVAPKEIRATWLELPAISNFLGDGDKTKLNEVKRSAWAQLKILKSKMESA